MGVRIDSRWSYCGLRCIRLENEHMVLDVLPEVGGKIIRLIDKAADRDLLWHSPRVELHRALMGANFDDHWAGGWDDVFPTGSRCPNQTGDELPHMGELWAQRWDWHVERADENTVELVLETPTPVTPSFWRKRIALCAGDPVLRLRYRLENTGTLPFDYNWGLHPALDVTRPLRLDAPALRGEVASEWGGGKVGREGDIYDWPKLGEIDLRQTQPPESRSYALHFLPDLREGWLAATDPAAERGFGLVFDRTVFSVAWLWLVYGGWRGYSHVIMEPWTGYPSALDEASAAGHCLTLDAGAVLETEVCGVLYHGARSISHLGVDGSIRP
jgi:galactose mutarotase-like enzyme